MTEVEGRLACHAEADEDRGAEDHEQARRHARDRELIRAGLSPDIHFAFHAKQEQAEPKKAERHPDKSAAGEQREMRHDNARIDRQLLHRLRCAGLDRRLHGALDPVIGEGQESKQIEAAQRQACQREDKRSREADVEQFRREKGTRREIRRARRFDVRALRGRNSLFGRGHWVVPS
jgi:hypothetical protein